MGLAIEVKSGETNWFTNQDPIQGTAKLDLKAATDITSVKITLCGVVKTSLSRVDDVGQKFTDSVEDEVIFLHSEKQLFPPTSHTSATKYTLQAGAHEWPFDFVFPSVNTSGVLQYILPPSLSDIDPYMASIRYYLELKYEKSSVVLGGTKKVRHYIDFLPYDDSWIDRVPTYGAIASHKARVLSNVKSVSGLFSRILSSLAHDNAPNCVDTAEFVVRSELLLTPGQKFTWFMEVSNYHSSKETITVTSVKVILQYCTYIRAKNVEENVENQIVLVDKPNLNIKAPADVTSQMQKSVLMIPECVPPTFQTANIKRDYKLLYKIKWSHKPGSALSHKTEMSQRVYIRSGISSLPTYETGTVYRPSRTYPQAKWYYK